jgi:hypothetical protein
VPEQHSPVEAAVLADARTLGDLGGLHAVLADAEILATSPALPLVLHVATTAADAPPDLIVLRDLVVDGLRRQGSYLAFADVADIVADSFVAEPATDRVFADALAIRIEERYADTPAADVIAAAALEALLRLAVAGRVPNHRVLAIVENVAVDVEPAEFARRAVSVIGLAMQHWPAAWIWGILERLLDQPDTAGAAALELGLARLGAGFSSRSESELVDQFREANVWFRRARNADADLGEAALWAAATSTVIAFASGASPNDVVALAAETRREALVRRAWEAGFADKPWMGLRSAAESEWSNLSELVAASAQLAYPELHRLGPLLEAIVRIFAATRAMTFGGEHARHVALGRIDTAFTEQVVLRDALSHWAGDDREDAVLRAAAADLLGYLPARDDLPGKSAATGDWIAPVAELLGVPAEVAASLPPELTGRLLDQRLEPKLPDPLLDDILARVTSALAGAPDLANYETRSVFFAVAGSALRYLRNRQDLTRAAQNKRLSFLFSWGAGAAPLEQPLADDFAQWLESGETSGYTLTEVRNHGGGRVDIMVTVGPTRIVVEVKRSFTPVDPETARAFLGQAGMYQGTNVTLGFLLILDLSPKVSGFPPHLRSNVWVERARMNETDQWRHVVVLVVQGNKQDPSSAGPPPRTALLPDPCPRPA